MQPKLWGVYLLLCADTSLYCGITTDIERRLKAHNNGSTGAKYTRAHRPVELLAFTGTVMSRQEALRLERKIKNLPRMRKVGGILQAVLP